MTHAELIHLWDVKQHWSNPEAILCKNPKDNKVHKKTEKVRLTINGAGTDLICGCGYSEPASSIE